jgi:hypothetical protein
MTHVHEKARAKPSPATARRGAARDESGDMIERLVREARCEKRRLARLSLRVTGIETRPRRMSALRRLDLLIGDGDALAGKEERVTLLCLEELERAEARAPVVIDFATRERWVAPCPVTELAARVRDRIRRGDVIPGILFRERPHLAHLADLAATALAEEQHRAALGDQGAIRRTGPRAR